MMGPGASSDLGFRTVRATAATVGPEAALASAQGDRAVRATAPAVGPGGEGGEQDVINDEFSKY